MKILTQDNQLINYDEVQDIIMTDVFHLGIDNPEYFVHLIPKYSEIDRYAYTLGIYSTKEKTVDVLKQIIEQNDTEQKTFIMPKEEKGE